jgi:hypothetical protein
MSQSAVLPPGWIVGFTGHRRLRNPEAVAEVMRELVASLIKEIPGQLVGHSSVAIGGDTLFAEICLAAGIPWIALLPVAEDNFRSDFSEGDWARARALLHRAARVDSLAAVKDRNLAYLEAGLATVEEADVMIALWDGQPSRGTGGTADVVAHARVLGKPLIIVHPDELSLARERVTPELFVDAEMNYLNQLPPPISSSEPSGSSDDPKEILRCFFQKVDAEASRTAPRFRRWVAASVIMNTVAAILVAAAIGFGVRSLMLDTIVFMLVGAAVLSIVQIKRKRAHQNWIRSRVAAEICRSALATWHVGEVTARLWFHLADFSRLAKSIRLLQMRAQDPPGMTLADRRESYLTHRISDQFGYFHERSRRLQFALTAFTYGFWIFSGIGMGRTLFAAVVGLPAAHPLFTRFMQSFLPIALPLAAGCALSLISIFDLARQLESSRAMENVLETVRDRIGRCENLSSLRRAVESAENTFAGEFLEWFTLFKFPRFH